MEYASSSVTRRTVSTATDRAVVTSRTDRRSDRERRGPNPRPASGAVRAPRPRAVARPRPPSPRRPPPGRRRRSSRPRRRRCSVASARSSLRSLPLNVVFAPGSGANARTRRTTASAGRVQSTIRSAGPSLGARVAVPACGVGVTVPSARRGQHVRDRLGADPREPRAERAGVVVRPDRLLAPGQHGTGVQAFVHAHHRDAGDGVAFEDRVLDRARPAPSRQEREVQVHRAEAGRVHHVAGEQLAVRHDDRHVGVERAELRHEPVVARRLGLIERERQPARGIRDRRRRERGSSTRGTWRVRHHQDHVDAVVASEALERRDRPRVVAEERRPMGEA